MSFIYRKFSYVNYKAAPYKYISQLGVILKRGYPTCLLRDRDEDGVLIREQPALDWPDYFLGTLNNEGMTNEDRVLYEFWVRGMFLLVWFIFILLLIHYQVWFIFILMLMKF
jgi:hypothetical protein